MSKKSRPCTNTKCPVCKNGKCTDPSEYILFSDDCPEYQDRYSSGRLTQDDMDQA